MKKLVIFDLDGTLLNTIADLANSVNYALEKHGYSTYPEADYKYFVGNGADKLIERVLPSGVSMEIFNSVKKDFINQYTTNAAIYTAPYKDINELLEKLQEEGIALAVASNKPHNETVKVVAHYFPDVNFKKVFGHRTGYFPKPDPQIVFDILNDLNISKEETAYVGDSSVDMQTANNSGIFSVGCTWGFRTEEELLENGANAIIHSPLELIPLVLNS